MSCSQIAMPATLLLLLASGTACHPKSAPPPGGYRTVARNLQRDTDRAKHENAQALELIDKGKWEDAEKPLKDALTADLTFGPAHNNLGRVYYEQGKFYLAAWEFEYAAKLMPNEAQPRNNLGLVLEETGKLDEAIEQYDQGLALNPQDAQIIGNAARARLRRGDHDTQVKLLLQKVIDRDTRPQWLQWARENLVLLEAHNARAATAPTSVPAPR